MIDNKVSAVAIPDSLKSRGMHLNTKFLLPFDDFERFYFGLGLNPSFQTGKTLAFDSSGFRMRTSGYLIYESSEDLILEGGVTFRSEYDSDYFPYLGLRYKINEDLLFKVISNESEIASYLDYQWTEKDTFFGEFAYELDEFEVTKGGNKGKIIEYQDASVGLGVKHRFNEYFGVSFIAGGIFSRQLKYLDGTGKLVPEASPYVAVSFVAGF